MFRLKLISYPFFRKIPPVGQDPARRLLRLSTVELVDAFMTGSIFSGDYVCFYAAEQVGRFRQRYSCYLTTVKPPERREDRKIFLWLMLWQPLFPSSPFILLLTRSYRSIMVIWHSSFSFHRKFRSSGFFCRLLVREPSPSRLPIPAKEGRTGKTRHSTYPRVSKLRYREHGSQHFSACTPTQHSI